MGLRSIPFGIAAVVLGFVLKSAGTQAEPSDLGVHPERSNISVFGTIHPTLMRLPTPTGSQSPIGIRLASLDPQAGAAALLDDEDLVAALGDPEQRASFEERFASFAPADSFDDRFGTPRRPAAASPIAGGMMLASAGSVPVTLSRPLRETTTRPMGRLPEASPTVEAPKRHIRPGQPRPASLPPVEDDGKTAIYDITAKTVYLPNGKRLEAHSGLGPMMDDPRHVHVRMHGATPPNVYRLTMREKLFHGVRALRMTPVDQSRMHGRAGILAHSYMLGPSGQSNGCVSFNNYPEFLNAYLRGEVNKIVVVERLDNVPGPKVASSNWFTDTLGKLFKTDDSGQYAAAQ
ncbi:hypothetical protein J2S22_005752 [Rhodoplanes tepidamans]|uniref:DUF2778 domain-containing protein n=1 Tax=Rhodoplanes tepidamans TaxID=200616 RepID=A0ABT5JG46_RHOTP|nr:MULTISPECIES: DUF2778 domain-containing protein [Rhodoplanes]MDC7788316.1 DUF2778 domain-containing protein [Rhodoplanes tepidamans]MDQ0358797.1 hypothetical protein [Rhodoplanes tepidamans]